ncbi:TPA: helix-turn-helix domain-containing protein [Burkholderia cepacia]
MESMSWYLDEAKTRLNLPSDYALAKVLGVTHVSISNLRSGKTTMGIDTCVKVAEILDIDPHLLYSRIQIDKARTPETALFWRTFAEKFSEGFRALALLANAYGARLPQV